MLINKLRLDMTRHRHVESLWNTHEHAFVLLLGKIFNKRYVCFFFKIFKIFKGDGWGSLWRKTRTSWDGICWRVQASVAALWLRQFFLGGRHWCHMTEFVFQKCIAKKGMFQWLICFGRACGGETMRCLCDREGRFNRFNFSNTVHSCVDCCQQMSRCNRNLSDKSRHGIQHDRQLWTFAPPSWRDAGAKFFGSRNWAWHSNWG